MHFPLHNCVFMQLNGDDGNANAFLSLNIYHEYYPIHLPHLPPSHLLMCIYHF